MNAYDDFLSFELRSRDTGQNLLGLFGIYNEDTVKIYNEQGEKVFNGPVDLGGTINLRGIIEKTDTQDFSDTVSKQYYLYLNQFDTDTIRVDFMLNRNRCNDAILQSVQVYFNNVLYIDRNKVNKNEIEIGGATFLK